MPNENKKECCPGLKDLLIPGMFKALGDPNRIAILVRLAEGCAPSTVSQIAECCPVNLSVVSRHLATLKEEGILRAEKRGKEVHYSVCTSKLVETLRGIADAIEACCPSGSCELPEEKGSES